MKKAVKYGIPAAAAAAVVIGSVLYFTGPDKVSTETPEKRDLRLEIREIGVVTADAPLTYYAPVSGTIASVNYLKNDSIDKDAVLADYDLALLEQEYNIASIQASYQQDGYKAATAENEKNTANAEQYAERDADYENQFIAAANESNALENIINIRGEDVEIIRAELETDIGKASSDMDLAKADYEAKQARVSELETLITSANAEISAADTTVAEIQTRLDGDRNRLALLDRESPEYASLAAQIEAENMALEEAITQSDSLRTGRSTYEEALRTARGERDLAMNNVNAILDTLSSYQNQLSALPIEGITDAEQGRVNALSSQIELINRQWSESMEKKATAEASILNQHQLHQYEDAYLLAKAAEDQKRDILEKGKKGVVSTVDGVVIERLVDNGAYVEEGTPLFVVQPDSGYKVSVMISRYDIGNIAVGNKAEVTIGDSVYSGKVSAISPIAEEDATGKPRAKVEISFDDSSVRSIIGIEAEITIVAKEKASALSVSKSSVYTDDEGDYVYVISGGKVEKRYIKKGISGSSYSEITDGLSGEDRVITGAVSDENIGDRVTSN